MTRAGRLLPAGVPRYVRVYDNGGRTYDRYIAVFCGSYLKGPAAPGYPRGQYVVLCMSENPQHPQGVGITETYPNLIDRPRSKHLGTRIHFKLLPQRCQDSIISTYKHIWRIHEFDNTTE